MSAERLREAAALMRSRAEAAAAESVDLGLNWWGVEGVTKVITSFAEVKGHAIDGIEADAEHIASWHPAVALAVAAVLESAANAVEFDTGAGLDDREATSGFEAEFALADAYLGSTS